MIKNILEIADIDFLQNLQDFFSKTMNIASIMVDHNGPITQPSNFTCFCSKLMRENKNGKARCNDCDIKWGEIAAKRGVPQVYTCHAGLKDFVVPIIVENEHIATIIGGQVLTERPKEEEFRKLAVALGIDEEECLTEIRKVNIISDEKIEGAIDFLYNVANSISAVLYANLKLTKLGMNYKLSRPISIEDWFFSKCPKLPRPITEREFEVLKLIVMGKSNTEIAEELCISVHTAKAHVSSILEKFLVEDRVQIAVKAVREGFI